MDEEIFEKLKDFTLRESMIGNIALTRNTVLAKDLGINGDDAVEFLVAYSKLFNVDVSNFMAADYFEGEGDLFLPEILDFFLSRPKELYPKKILTLGHLEKGITAGKLDDSVIANNV